MNINIIGTVYVGLVTGECLADLAIKYHGIGQVVFDLNQREFSQ